MRQAVILAGGLGTRLGSLTSTCPKPLLPVGGRPFIHHLIQELTRFGIQEVLVIAGKFGDQVESAFEGSRINNVPVHVIVEPMPMGTGGALKFAFDQGKLDREFMLCNGDSWVDADLIDFQLSWIRQRSRHPHILMQLVARQVPDAGRYGALTICGGIVTRFADKAKETQGRSGQINAGVYLIDRRVVENIETVPCSLENDVMPDLAKQGFMAAWPCPDDAYFIDIGIPETYETADQELINKRRKAAIFFDRDGTLNYDDDGYTFRPESLVWKPGAKEAIELCNRLGYYVFVVSNQSGIVRGLYAPDDVLAFHRRMQSDLLAIGAHIDGLTFCPHHPDFGGPDGRECDCRKPKPGLLLELMNDWYIDRQSSIMIGDKVSDLEAAEAAGIRGQLCYSGDLLMFHQKFLKHARD